MLPAKAVTLWQAVLEKIEQKTTAQQFATWFRNLQLAELDEQRVVLRVPSKFHRDWIVTYYRDVVEESVATVRGGARELHHEEGGREGANGRASAPPPSAPTKSAKAEGGRPQAAAPSASGSAPTSTTKPSNVRTCGDLPLTEGYDLQRFVLGPSNQLAAAAAKSLATAPQVDFATLFIVGATGTGKTHLLQAAARAAAAKAEPGRQVAYVRGENFVNEFVTACAQGAEAASRFRDRWRGLDFVCFDDLQLLAGKTGTQAELIHTLNAWGDRGTRLLFAASCAPGETLNLDPTLQARLSGAYRVGLRTPDRETRLAMVVAKAKLRGETLPVDVAEFLAELPSNNVRELEGALTSVIAGAKLIGAPVTLKSARAALHDDTLLQRPSSSPDRILKAICHHFEVTVADLCSPRRPQALSFARQAAMFLLRERTELSLSEIGAQLGGRDHTTILHGIRKIDEVAATDSRAREHLSRLRAQLER